MYWKKWCTWALFLSLGIATKGSIVNNEVRITCENVTAVSLSEQHAFWHTVILEVFVLVLKTSQSSAPPTALNMPYMTVFIAWVPQQGVLRGPLGGPRCNCCQTFMCEWQGNVSWNMADIRAHNAGVLWGFVSLQIVCFQGVGTQEKDQTKCRVK